MTELRRTLRARWRARAARAVLATAAAAAPVAALAADKGSVTPAQPACRLRLHVIETVPVGPLSMQVFREQVEQVWAPHGFAFEWRSGPPVPAAEHPGVVIVVLAPVRLGVVSAGPSWSEGMTPGTVGFSDPVSPVNVLRVVVAT